jgi:hypothetical protein
VRELYLHWRSKARDERLPGRQDFDPLNLQPWLGKLALLDVLGNADDFHYRLYGTDLVVLFGEDLTCRHLSTLKCPKRSELLAGYRGVVQDRRPWIRTEELTRDGSRISVCQLVLPLARDGENVDMLLQCVWVVA